MNPSSKLRGGLLNVRFQVSLILVSLVISMLISLQAYSEPIVGSSGTNVSDLLGSEQGGILDESIIRMLTDIMDASVSVGTHKQTNGDRILYLDKNRKVIFLPSREDSVHKFHPNGRYGRSMGPTRINPYQMISGHTELGQERSNGLAFNEGPSPPNPYLLMNRLGKPNVNVNNELAMDRFEAPVNDPELGSMQQELNKLLKCEFTGTSNLYWCTN